MTEKVSRYFELLALEQELRAEVIRTQSGDAERHRVSVALTREHLLFHEMTDAEVVETSRHLRELRKQLQEPQN